MNGDTNLAAGEEDVPRNTSSAITTEEEEEFARELAKMIAETGGGQNGSTAVEAGRKNDRNPTSSSLFSDQGLPVLKNLLKYDGGGGSPASAEDDGSDKMTFSLLTKKGNKQQVCDICFELAVDTTLTWREFTFTALVEVHADPLIRLDCGPYTNSANAWSRGTSATQEIGARLWAEGRGSWKEKYAITLVPFYYEQLFFSFADNVLSRTTMAHADMQADLARRGINLKFVNDWLIPHLHTTLHISR